MHKNILTIVGIVILFLGVGIQPVFAEIYVDKENYYKDDFDIDNSNCFIIGRIKEKGLILPFFSLFLNKIRHPSCESTLRHICHVNI